MSIYQNNYFIVPKKGKYTLFEGLNLHSFFDDIFFDDHLLWENNDINYDHIEKYLSDEGIELGESWSKELKIFGNIDLNCIKLLIEKKKITSASFRINFTTNYTSFLKKVIIFCERFDLFIVDNDLNILENEFDIIKNNLFKSKAYNNYKNFNKLQ